MRTHNYGVFALLACVCPCRIDSATAQVDAYINSQMDDWHVPGVSIGVVHNGEVVLAKGYGLANVELSVPATADTVYELLSVAKQFTAAAVLLLVGDGKVALDAKVADYLPDTPAAWADVTIRHLLGHMSGIADYTDAPGFFEHLGNEATPDELLAPVREQPLQFDPGAKWRYSNSNYYLLGMVIERVSGTSLDQFLAVRVFGPLGMTATRINDLTDVIANRAGGYHWLGEDADRMPRSITGFHGHHNVLQNAVSVSPTRKWAAGAVVSTVTDLVRWEQALAAGKLVPVDLADLAMRPVQLSDGSDAPYGFGNELGEVNGHRVAGHQGGGLAFNCTICRFVEDKLSVIVLCNQTSAPSRAIAARIASIYVPALAVDADPGITDTEPEVTAMLRVVLVDAALGKADPGHFAPGSELVAFVRRIGPGFLGRLGPLASMTLLERRDHPGKRQYRYRVAFAKDRLVWSMMLDPAGKIVALEPDQ